MKKHIFNGNNSLKANIVILIIGVVLTIVSGWAYFVNYGVVDINQLPKFEMQVLIMIISVPFFLLGVTLIVSSLNLENPVIKTILLIIILAVIYAIAGVRPITIAFVIFLFTILVFIITKIFNKVFSAIITFIVSHILTAIPTVIFIESNQACDPFLVIYIFIAGTLVLYNIFGVILNKFCLNLIGTDKKTIDNYNYTELKNQINLIYLVLFITLNVSVLFHSDDTISNLGNCINNALITGVCITNVNWEKVFWEKSLKNFAFKVKIKDIVNAEQTQLNKWEKKLKRHVNNLISKDNVGYAGASINKNQESIWVDSLKFIKESLCKLPESDQEYDLIFEYSMKETILEMVDVILLTNSKVILLEFNRLEVLQSESNKDNVDQVIRYKELLETYHKEIKDREIKVLGYLVCTHDNAVAGKLRDVDVLTTANFCDVITNELRGESLCSFVNEWLTS